MSERKSLEKDRHSNSVVYGVRGGPKKGGAGGKGTWGKGGKDDLITVSSDAHDPNYNSEDDESEEVVLNKVEVTTPIEAIVQEYFSSGDVEECAKALKELNIEDQHHTFVRKSITIAMEKGAFERELVSQLLSSLYANVLSGDKISEGFQSTLDMLEEIRIDIPDAADLYAKFLGRAVVDEIVPPAFLKTAETPSNVAKEALALASALTTEKHRIDRLAHIWGPGDLGSVKRLKEESQTILEEFITTGDMNEADKCVRKLSAPSFHFQLVKQAVRLALQKTEEERKRVLALLSFFAKTGLVSGDHMAKGFQCCYDNLNDIKLDVPNADKVLAELTQAAKSEGWLTLDQ